MLVAVFGVRGRITVVVLGDGMDVGSVGYGLVLRVAHLVQGKVSRLVEILRVPRPAPIRLHSFRSPCCRRPHLLLRVAPALCVFLLIGRQ